MDLILQVVLFMSAAELTFSMEAQPAPGTQPVAQPAPGTKVRSHAPYEAKCAAAKLKGDTCTITTNCVDGNLKKTYRIKRKDGGGWRGILTVYNCNACTCKTCGAKAAEKNKTTDVAVKTPGYPPYEARCNEANTRGDNCTITESCTNGHLRKIYKITKMTNCGGWKGTYTLFNCNCTSDNEIEVPKYAPFESVCQAAKDRGDICTITQKCENGCLKKFYKITARTCGVWRGIYTIRNCLKCSPAKK